jgi:hypothetical protein
MKVKSDRASLELREPLFLCNLRGNFPFVPYDAKLKNGKIKVPFAANLKLATTILGLPAK